ncbi:MAG: hypothetical protein WBV74_19655 [Pseudonocardiaceae bacterium]
MRRLGAQRAGIVHRHVGDDGAREGFPSPPPGRPGRGPRRVRQLEQESKINLFELVVGELDMILGRVTDDFDFESSVFTAYVAAADDAAFAASLDGLGADLARARSDYLRTRGAVDQLVGED